MIILVFILIVLALVAAFIVTTIRIVDQSDAYIIERLGRYWATWDSGIHFLIPGIDRIRKKVDLREQTADFEPQSVITKDNVTMQIDTVVYFQVIDPKLLAYGVNKPIRAIETLTATTLRNIVGDMELDETLTSRDVVNAKMREVLDEATDRWGIKITRCEIKTISTPEDVRSAMEKQVKAERERRAKETMAEGERRATVLTAQGKKEALVLEATAKKEAMIAEAQGRAESMRLVVEAQKEAIKEINEAEANSYIKLKALEAIEKLADGNATKIIIPSDLQNFATKTSLLGDLFNNQASE